MTARVKAAEAYVRGDGAKVDTIVPHSGAASFHSPAGDTERSLPRDNERRDKRSEHPK
jgi:hypothetical protein